MRSGLGGLAEKLNEMAHSLAVFGIECQEADTGFFGLRRFDDRLNLDALFLEVESQCAFGANGDRVG